jgi:hypothetical protein
MHQTDDKTCQRNPLWTCPKRIAVNLVDSFYGQVTQAHHHRSNQHHLCHPQVADAAGGSRPRSKPQRNVKAAMMETLGILCRRRDSFLDLFKRPNFNLPDTFARDIELL